MSSLGFQGPSQRRFGPLTVEFAACRALLDGAEVPLTPTEFALLAGLARLPGQAITSRDLLRLMWDGDWQADTTPLQVHVSRLRRKLGESAAQPRFIRTVRNVGYRLDPGRDADSVKVVELLLDHDFILRRITPNEPFLGYYPDAILGTFFSPSGLDEAGMRTMVEALIRVGQTTLDSHVYLNHGDGGGSFVRVVNDILLDTQGRPQCLSIALHLPG